MRINKEKMKLFMIALLTICSRGILLDIYPVGVHADEAFAAYEAYSMLKYGIDSWGYINPVYLTTWGSGMSALESYMMMPFVSIFGLNTWTIRMPQMIMGCISVWILYLLVKKVKDKEMAIWAGFLLAICPWHIMMSRWGLDANLAPAFVLLGMYFGVLGLEKKKYLVLSSVFWGLSLYCYALMWIFVPAFLVLTIIYCASYKKIGIDKYSVMSILVLGLIALPLIVFVFVNMGVLPEITMKYISIPQLPEFRSGELTLENIFTNMKKLFKIYLKQNDDNLMNVTRYFGLYYLYSLPFIVVGGMSIVWKTIRNLKKKLFGYEIFLLIWITICIVIGLMKTMNVYRANCLNMAIFLVFTEGISCVCKKFSYKWFENGIVILYIFSFLVFESYYFTDYQTSIRDIQLVGADKALSYAIEQKEEKGAEYVRITGRLRHSQVLFYQKYPVDIYRKSVKWKNYPAKWLETKQFGEFLWDIDVFDYGDIYIICEDEIDRFKDEGYTITNFDFCAVAVYE